jgi:lipopolysaccharide/colanic/teichoic acid biosynthesis glycosyltransferase
MLYKRFGKRLIDIVVSGLGLLVLSPLFILIGIMVWIKLGRPIFFTQIRPGLNAEPFKMIKFRTMRDSIGSNGNQLPDELRLTKLGKFFRSTSLDELPELWNVLRGDMSLVGPRPLLMEYLPLYSKEQYRRHEVKPGITGLAQVSGRNNISWSKKFSLDVDYIQTYNLYLDIKICFLTVYKVLKQSNINPSDAILEKFNGKN